jgi:hypothetical protein
MKGQDTGRHREFGTIGTVYPGAKQEDVMSSKEQGEDRTDCLRIHL